VKVLNNLVNPAVAITEKGMIQVFNKPAQALWGYTLTEVRPRSYVYRYIHILVILLMINISSLKVVGKNVKMLMTADFADKHDAYLSNYMATGKAKIIGILRCHSLSICFQLLIISLLLGTGRDVPILVKDGSVKTVHLSISERKDGEASVFTGVCSLSEVKQPHVAKK